MKYLAIDTSGAHLTVIAAGEKTEIRFIESNNLKHSINLMGEIEGALEAAKLDIKDVDFFAVCVGPGSFTGIRIGVSAVKAFAYSLNKKILSVTALDILAYNIQKGRVLSVIDAGHGGYYASGYSDKQLILQPSYITETELESLKYDYTVIDSKNADLVNGFISYIKQNYTKAACENTLTPLYIRKSQAEEGL